MSEDILRLVTRPEREAAEHAKEESRARDEVVEMLHVAMTVAKERGACAVAVCFAFPDGSFGNLVPSECLGVGALLGSIADCQFRILANMNFGEAEE